ncbi:MAG TPA: hypothetical protein ENL23_08425 [Candidatus Acetothermia bacterium]|nr:hypothetical protein [Candidatus Acetothermia bacterium]
MAGARSNLSLCWITLSLSSATSEVGLGSRCIIHLENRSLAFVLAASDTGRDYVPFSALATWYKVASGQSTTGTVAIPIDYEYLLTTVDPPGDCAVTLTYRVIVSWGSYQLYVVSQDVTLYRRVKDWILVSMKKSIDLGTVDGSGYVMGTGLPARESLDDGAFIISNSPAGWDLALQVGSISTPPCYSGDLLFVFFWQVDSSAFHSASGLKVQPVTITSSTGLGKSHHTLGYRYTPTTAECEGDYSITLVYTATSR